MPKQAKLPPRVLNCLFVGTSEVVAKSAPLRGLDAPLVLTDSYPGFFAEQESKGGRWGILEIDIETLSPEYFAPYTGYIAKLAKGKDLLALAERYKAKWRQSLANCGTCIYLGPVPPQSIYRVAVFAPSANKGVSSTMAGMNPAKFSPPDHKEQRVLHNFLSRWASAYPVSLMETLNGHYDHKRFGKLEQQLSDRTAVDLFYLRSEHPTPWWKV